MGWGMAVFGFFKKIKSVGLIDPLGIQIYFLPNGLMKPTDK
jgi:hypothetical protein